MSRKLPEDRLPPERRIPRVIRMPDGAGSEFEVATDVVEMGPPTLANADPESAVRPVPGGVSCSVPGSGGNGTLGAWVLDRLDETVVALSNRHVLGGVPGAPVIQPGSVDGGTLAEHRIGTVKRVAPLSVAPPNPTPADCNFIDAGIVRADDPDLIELTVLEVGAALYEIGTATRGTPVQKFGQTTGYTTGRILDMDYAFSIPVPLSPGNFQQVVFCDCYLVRGDPDLPLPGFLSNGDSGSVLFGFADEADAVIHPAVGLNFALADGNGVACKIQNVFSALDLDVLCASGFTAAALFGYVKRRMLPRAFKLGTRTRCAALGGM